MKDLVKKVKSFITFDYPLQTAYISTQFTDTHKKLQTDIPEWSTAATRQKLVSRYWFYLRSWTFYPDGRVTCPRSLFAVRYLHAIGFLFIKCSDCGTIKLPGLVLVSLPALFQLLYFPATAGNY